MVIKTGVRAGFAYLRNRNPDGEAVQLALSRKYKTKAFNPFRI